MLQNAFAHLQKIGKSLMLPVSVLPVASILLWGRFCNVPAGCRRWWFPPFIAEALWLDFCQYAADIRSQRSVALRFTHNDDVVALAALAAYGIIGKTIAMVAPLILR